MAGEMGDSFSGLDNLVFAVRSLPPEEARHALTCLVCVAYDELSRGDIDSRRASASPVVRAESPEGPIGKGLTQEDKRRWFDHFAFELGDRLSPNDRNGHLRGAFVSEVREIVERDGYASLRYSKSDWTEDGCGNADPASGEARARAMGKLELLCLLDKGAGLPATRAVTDERRTCDLRLEMLRDEVRADVASIVGAELSALDEQSIESTNGVPNRNVAMRRLKGVKLSIEGGVSDAEFGISLKWHLPDERVLTIALEPGKVQGGAHLASVLARTALLMVGCQHEPAAEMARVNSVFGSLTTPFFDACREVSARPEGGPISLAWRADCGLDRSRSRRISRSQLASQLVSPSWSDHPQGFLARSDHGASQS